MNRYRVSLTVAVAVMAIALPPAGLARALVGTGPHLEAVVGGIWMLKVLLLAHAALAWFIMRAPGWSPIDLPLARPWSERSAPGGRAGAIGIALALVLVLAVILRAIGLNAGLWFDEIQTLVDYVRRPLGYILTTYDSQNNHLLYSVLAKLSVLALGESAWTLRLPAALFGISSIGAVYFFGKVVTSRRESFLAALLLTVSYHHVWFSQNARGYTGLLVGTLVATTVFLHLLQTRHPSWRAVLGYAVTMALAVYIHLTAAIIVAAHVVVWGALVWKGKPGRRSAMQPALWAVGLATTFSLTLYAVVLPQLPATLFGTGASHATEWQSPLWMLMESARGLSRGLPGGPLVLVLGLGLVTVGWVSYWRRSPAAAVLMVLPAVLTGLAAVVLSHNLWPRLFFFSAGFAILIVIRGVFAIVKPLAPRRGAIVATAVVALVAVVSAATVPGAWGPKQDFGGAVAFIEANRGAGDAVVTVDLTSYPVTQYLERSWARVDDAKTLEAIEQDHARTWLLYTFPVRLSAVEPAIWERITSHYETAAVFPGSVGGGDVVVMVTP